METLGAYLKSKREALHISLQEVSQVTRIRRSILEAIENNRYDLLPPKVFAQGFIKSYAAYLGLDESEAIKRYSEMVDVPDTEAKSMEVYTPPSPARFLFIVIVVTILLLGGAYLLWKNYREKTTTGMVPQQTDSAVASRVLMTPPAADDDTSRDDAGRDEEAPGSWSSTIETDEGGPAATMVEPQSSESAGQHTSGTADQSPPAATVEENPDAVTAGLQTADGAAKPLALKIIASQTTWMKLQADREQPVQFTLRKGQTRTVNAEEKFTIRIGNAGGVDLFLNGQELGRPGKPGEVLDLTLPE